MTIACKGQIICVVLNGKPMNTMDRSKWTSAKNNPDGSEIPEWLSTPFSDLKAKAFIGLQGKHAGAKVFLGKLKLKICKPFLSLNKKDNSTNTLQVVNDI